MLSLRYKHDAKPVTPGSKGWNHWLQEIVIDYSMCAENCTLLNALRLFSDDGEGWETVTSKNRQPKHLKNTKTLTESSKPSLKNEDVFAKSVSSNLESIPPTTALHSNSSYVNVVVDRIIGLEGMGSPPSGGSASNANKTTNATPLWKSHSQETVGKSPAKKVKFRADTEKGKIFEVCFALVLFMYIYFRSVAKWKFKEKF